MPKKTKSGKYAKRQERAGERLERTKFAPQLLKYIEWGTAYSCGGKVECPKNAY